MRTRTTWPGLSLLCASACFDSSVADDAQILCVSNNDCPAPLTCNVDTHLCSRDVDAPSVAALRLVDPPEGATYADVEGFDTIIVDVESSEPIPDDGVALSAGPLSSRTCSPRSPGEAQSTLRRCSLVVPPGATVDGPLTLTATVVDESGNGASATLPIAIDTRPPEVVTDSVAVEITTAAIETAVARADSVVRVELVVNEDLGEAPLLVLDVDGDRRPLTLLAVAGRRYSFVRDDASTIVAGTYPLALSMRDRFGHASETAVPLPEPYESGIPFVEDGAICARPAGVTCVDVDNDTFFAAGSCADGNDLDDFDPTVHPGAVEIPGDGKDNDGVAGDRAIDETAGFFVDSEAGDDNNPGTRVAPFRTLDPEAASLGVTIFVAARATPAVATQAVNANLVGGLEPGSWTLGSTRSVVVAAQLDTNLIVNIDSDAAATMDAGIVLNSSLTSLQIDDNGIRVINSTLNDLDVAETASARVEGSTIVTVDVNGALDIGRSRVVNGVELRQAGSLVATNCVLEARDEAVVRILSATDVAIYHSSLMQLSQISLPIIETDASGGLNYASLTLVAVSMQSLSAVVQVSEADANTLTVIGSNFFGPGPALSVAGVVTDDVNGCEAIGCVLADGNTALDPGGLEAHLVSTSPLRGIAPDAIDAGAPTSVVADLDRQCRYEDGAPDIGADEVL